MTETATIEYMGSTYRVVELREEARRYRAHADNIEKYDAGGACRSRARADRIETILRHAGRQS